MACPASTPWRRGALGSTNHRCPAYWHPPPFRLYWAHVGDILELKLLFFVPAGNLKMVESPTNRDTGRIFVGREREIAELTSALDDALAGEGRLVMLAGEPGIGKARTAQELASYAEEKDAVVLWGWCYEDEGRSDVLRLPKPTQGYAGGPLFECGLVDFQREVSDSHRTPRYASTPESTGIRYTTGICRLVRSWNLL